MRFELYPHQQQAIDDLRAEIMRGYTRLILAMSTGSGKTVVASEIARSAAAKGKQVLFVVHLTELVSQAVDAFSRMGLSVGILRGDDTHFLTTDDVIVASIQTIRARSAPSWVELVLIDEAHVLHQAHKQLIAEWTTVPFIGLTATPFRSGLGQHFQRIVRGPSLDWLTTNGFLVPARCFAPAMDAVDEALSHVSTGNTPEGKDYKQSELGEAMNQRRLVGDIVSTWKAEGENRSTLCFAVDKAHSRSIVDDFNAAGITAAHIEDRTKRRERNKLIAAFKQGEIKILSSVTVLATGFDAPNASCLILARPTLSESLHIQQIGRGLRTFPDGGKTDCKVLDHAGNLLRHGPPASIELPAALDSRSERERAAKKRAKSERDPFISCSSCHFVFERGPEVCPHCGIDAPQPPRRTVISIDGALVEYGSGKTKRKASVDEIKRWYRGFLWICDERGYKRGAAFHYTREKFVGFSPPPDWRDLQPEPPADDVTRWMKARRIRYAKAKRRA